MIDHNWEGNKRLSPKSMLGLGGASRQQLTGLSAVNPTRMVNFDARGNVAESWAEFNPDTKIKSSFQRTPYATNLAVTRSQFGREKQGTDFYKRDGMTHFAVLWWYFDAQSHRSVVLRSGLSALLSS